MSSHIFQGIKPDTPWQCDRCGIPNFMDSTLFYYPDVPLANRYSALSEPDQLDDKPGSPLHTSSPKAAQNLPNDIPPIKNRLRSSQYPIHIQKTPHPSTYHRIYLPRHYCGNRNPAHGYNDKPRISPTWLSHNI